MTDRGQRPGALLLGLAALAAAWTLLPLAALVVRVPWADAPSVLTDPSALVALRLSVGTAAVSAVLCLVLGAPLALVLARCRFPGRGLLRAAVLVPLVLPPVVSGLALLMTVGRTGLLAPLLDPAGVRIVFTTTAVVLAQTFVSLPFMVLTLEAALASLDPRPEQAAAGLGASRARVLRTITLPRLAPALATGTVLAFARSLGEFGATLTVAGSLEGTTRTLPLQIFLTRETDPPQAILLSFLLIITAAAVVLAVHSRRPARREERR